MTTTADKIVEVCDRIKAMLLEKNAAYGDSALDPIRVFSKADTTEQIRVRLDDKLSRLKRGSLAGEDVVLDLVGYLVLLIIAGEKPGQDPFNVPGRYGTSAKTNPDWIALNRDLYSGQWVFLESGRCYGRGTSRDEAIDEARRVLSAPRSAPFIVGPNALIVKLDPLWDSATSSRSSPAVRTGLHKEAQTERRRTNTGSGVWASLANTSPPMKNVPRLQRFCRTAASVLTTKTTNFIRAAWATKS